MFERKDLEMTDFKKSPEQNERSRMMAFRQATSLENFRQISNSSALSPLFCSRISSQVQGTKGRMKDSAAVKKDNSKLTGFLLKKMKFGCVRNTVRSTTATLLLTKGEL